MTVYTDEVNIYNTDAIAQGIQEAHDAHKAYITEVSADNGIVVAAAGKGTVNGSITTATTGWHLADVLEFIKQGVSRFWIGLKNQTDSTPTVRIGKEYKSGASDNESRMELDYHSMQLMDKNDVTYFHVSDLRDANGNITDTFIGTGTKSQFLLSVKASSTDYVVKVDGVTQSSSAFSSKTVYYVNFNYAPSSNSVIVITYTPDEQYARDAKVFTFGNRVSNSKLGKYSYAEGENIISGENSHAEGVETSADGMSHAEGYKTVAIQGSHAEGRSTNASGTNSHAEGQSTVATGGFSHAQNLGTIARSSSQTAIGKYNIEDSNDKYALIIGNGEYLDPSNAFAVDWNGNTETAGHYYAEGLKVGHSWCYITDINDTTMTAQNTSSSPHVYTLQVTGISQVKPDGAFTYDSSKKGVKAAVAGWYEVSIQVSSSNSASGDLIGVGIHRVRSGADANVAGPEYERCAGTYARISMSPTPIYLQKDDILYATVQNNSTGGKTINTCRWMIRPLIG